MESVSSQLREWRSTRRALACESLPLCAVASALFTMAPRIETAGSEATFVFAWVVGLASLASLRLLLRLLRLLHFDCPRCAEPFCGTRTGLSLPFRSGCAHCGLKLVHEDPAPPPAASDRPA